MRILVTNDDGIHAEGLHTLVRVAKEFGEVKIAAPHVERSACGHAMTMRDPLRVKERMVESCQAWEVTGLPVDCVNVALTELWPDGCDLLLSGINWGPNLGFDVTYSGTVAGAMEGCINGIRSVAVSMAVFVDGAPPHYPSGENWLRENIQMLADTELPRLTFWNVNVPAIDWTEIRGTKFARMGERVYKDRVEKRADPWGRSYWWQGGVVVMDPSEPDTDVNAVSEGFVSVTPISLDWTNRAALEALQHHT